MFKDFESPIEPIEFEGVENDLAVESLKSWEKTLKDTFASYRVFDVKEHGGDFDATLRAFLSNAEYNTNPDRPGTDAGDHQFYQTVQKLKQAVALVQEGYSWDKVAFLVEELPFEDEHIRQDLIELLKHRYTA